MRILSLLPILLPQLKLILSLFSAKQGVPADMDEFDSSSISWRGSLELLILKYYMSVSPI